MFTRVSTDLENLVEKFLVSGKVGEYLEIRSKVSQFL